MMFGFMLPFILAMQASKNNDVQYVCPPRPYFNGSALYITNIGCNRSLNLSSKDLKNCALESKTDAVVCDLIKAKSNKKLIMINYVVPTVADNDYSLQANLTRKHNEAIVGAAELMSRLLLGQKVD